MADPYHHRAPNQESMLMDLVLRLDRLRVGRTGVHIRFSELSKAYRRERFIHIASESFAGLISSFEGHLFKLNNGDIFFIAKDVTPTALEAAVDRIRLLFSQDALAVAPLAPSGNRFCTFYRLENDYDQLLHDVRTLIAETPLHQIMASFEPTATPPQLETLKKIEQSLETVDVTNIARRQTVCTLAYNAIPQPLFEEIFISITDLQNAVSPETDLAANTWLFRYLTQTLDQRLMLMLIRDGVTSTRPFSLNLNIETLLTPEFARFESAIAPQLRGRLVIEINALDVFSDMTAFLFVRDYLHDHGFRLCLDGLTHHTLPYFDRSKLGFDLVKLNWSPNGLEDILPSSQPAVRNLVMETGQAHTILNRCDDENAVTIGQELGIVMFQGRHVDRLLSAARAPNAVLL